MLDGKRLERLVGGRGKELERFATAVGASVTGAKKWFDGSQPSVGYFVNMAHYFHLSLDELATEVGLIDAPKQRPALDMEWAAFLRDALAAGWTPTDARLGLEHVALSRRGRAEEAAAKEPRPKRGLGAK